MGKLRGPLVCRSTDRCGTRGGSSVWTKVVKGTSQAREDDAVGRLEEGSEVVRWGSEKGGYRQSCHVGSNWSMAECLGRQGPNGFGKDGAGNVSASGLCPLPSDGPLGCYWKSKAFFKTQGSKPVSWKVGFAFGSEGLATGEEFSSRGVC